MHQCSLTILLLASVSVTLSGCQPSADDEASTLTLATTTSTRDAGLLDMLLPVFESKTGIEVKVIAVGSGQAIRLAEQGNADVLLTHAPQAELGLMDRGIGRRREAVMHNDFVLVGPKSDPSQLRESKTLSKALQKIVDGETAFVSRDDDSGTHQKEQQLWARLGQQPKSSQILATGSGMAASLRVASEKQAYTLTDRGTFLAQRDRRDLAIAFENAPALENPYSVIVVDPSRHKLTHAAEADEFADFLLQPATQQLISDFGKNEFGEPLFFPAASSQ